MKKEETRARSQPVTAQTSLANAGSEPSAAHTPGPWRLDYADGWGIEADRGNYTTQQVFAGRAAPVCIVFEPGINLRHDTRLDANARLIAAAPDLYDALEFVMTAHGEQLHDAFDAAHRALGKANPAHAKDDASRARDPLREADQ